MAAVYERWGTNSPTLNQNTQIVFLSDQLGFSDPVNVDPILNASFLTFQGTPTLILAGLTIEAYTPRNYAAGTLDMITSTAVADWTPYINQYIVDSTAGALARIIGVGVSNNIAVISAPVQKLAAGLAGLAPGNPGASNPALNPPPWVTIVNGNAIAIYQPCKVFCINATTNFASEAPDGNIVGPNQGLASGVILRDIWSPSTPGSTLDGNAALIGNGTYLQQCRIDGFYTNFGGFRDSCVNTAFLGEVAASTRIYAGYSGFLTGSPYVGNFGLTVDGDHIAQQGIGVQGGQVILGSVYSGSDVGGDGNAGPGVVMYLTGTGPNNNGFGSIFYPDTTAKLWGPGSIQCTNGMSFQVDDENGTSATSSILVTGAPQIVIDGGGVNAQLVTYSAARTGTAASIPTGGATNEISGLTGVTTADIGRTIKLTGANTPANNNTFVINSVASSAIVTVAPNVNLTAPDGHNGAITWVIAGGANTLDQLPTPAVIDATGGVVNPVTGSRAVLTQGQPPFS
jgi:hypothetical protein